MRPTLFLALVAVAALAFGSAATAGDAPAEATRLVYQGSEGVAACSSCHALNGWGDLEKKAPALAGMNQAYMAQQIRDFAAGTRKHEFMDPVAKALTEAQIVATAELYAGLPRRAMKATIEPEVAARGARLATRGAWERELPACEQCHGPGGRGVGERFPTLAGQQAFYIEAQLKAWRGLTRKNDPLGMMKGIANRLTSDEIKAVAAYYDSLAPAPAPTTPPAAAPQPGGQP